MAEDGQGGWHEHRADHGRVEQYAPLDATFPVFWREDGTFSGGWRPNPGADEAVNVPTTSAGTVLNSL